MAAEAILVNGATEILKKLSAFVAEEIRLAWGVKDQLQKFKKTLDMILAVMIDAEKKQVKSEAVRLWLHELKDIAYEAEDIMDEYAYEVMHQRQMSRKRDKVRNFFSSSNPIVFRPKIAHEIKAVNEKFNEIAKRKESLGLQIIELGMSTSRTTNLDEISKLRETDSILDLSLKTVGRDNDKSNIIHMLFHNDSHNQGVNIQVIPIVGMGGLGKTTLAQLIYDDDKVNSHFDLKMWVCVSDDFDVKKLFVKIIESITNNKCDDVSNIDVIARQLQQHLSGKKYLLVLDDVWNKKREEWVSFRKHLLVGADGSKIIVTTRSDDVASIMGGKPYKLAILDDDESWSLFHKRTFECSGGRMETPTLVAIGKELVKKCEGLPLALNFLVGLLRNKDEKEWRVINKNKLWVQSYSEDDESRILPILKLSYDNLPSYLKQCFSYFSLFPKDYPFNLSTIISLWMAEGFLPQPSGGNNMSMEEVGNKYFKILLHNSFFQDVERNEFGQVLRFKMHDLVHDLVTYVVDNRECFVLVTDKSMTDIPSVHRLQLINYEEGINFDDTMAVVLKNNPKLRTLLVDDQSIKKIENNAFDGMKRLRVLDLSESLEIEEIKEYSMSNLKHLRFLDLSCSEITKLPKSVTRLFHLQTLKLKDCKNLKELPKGIGKLINLRHLWLPKDINLPRELGQLSSLQTLEPINGKGYGGGGGYGIEVLELLNLLNEDLTINQLGYVRSGIEARRANLMEKKNLNRIFLNWHTNTDPDTDTDGDDTDGDGDDADADTDTDGDDAADDGDGDGDGDDGIEARRARPDDCEYDKDEAVLGALQPHPNLKMLCIDQYFGVKLPQWMGDPSCLPNLVILQLVQCRKCEQLVGFGKLPSLKELFLKKMDGIKCLGNEFYYNNNNSGGGGGGGGGVGAETAQQSVLFPSLKELFLEDMGALEEWVDIPPTVSCFPCLEVIDIRGCPNLRITPTTRFPSLKELTLYEINARVVMPLITANFGNSLETVELEKISELKFLPPHWLLQGSNLSVLKVFDCLDFQGFLQSEEEDQNEEEEEEEDQNEEEEEEDQNEEEEEEEEDQNEEEEEEEEEEGFTSIEVLTLLRLPALKFLPDILSLTSLEELYIEDCESLKPLPEDLTCLPSSLEHLKDVEIRNVKEVDDFEWQK